jgi:Uma2 family endonuclease
LRYPILLQWAIAHLLYELLTDYLTAIGRCVKVGGNLPFLYRPADRKAQVTPDIYVFDNEPAEEQDLGCWKTWERGGKVPSLAIEVVSRASSKDYTLDPEGMLARYQDLGVPEAIRDDPAGHGPRRARRLLSHFTRNEAGLLSEHPLEQPDQVLIRRYGVWLLHVRPAGCAWVWGAPASWRSGRFRKSASTWPSTAPLRPQRGPSIRPSAPKPGRPHPAPDPAAVENLAHAPFRRGHFLYADNGLSASLVGTYPAARSSRKQFLRRCGAPWAEGWHGICFPSWASP